MPRSGLPRFDLAASTIDVKRSGSGSGVMTADPLRSYRFSTPAQWNTCLFDRADRDAPGVRPFAPYAQPAMRLASGGAHAPAVTRAGEIVWRDDRRPLYRLLAGDDAPEASPRAVGDRARDAHRRDAVAALGRRAMRRGLSSASTKTR